MDKKRRRLTEVAGEHPCVTVVAKDARFSLHPPTPFTLDLVEHSYKLLLPFSHAVLDVGLGGRAAHRLRLRFGDLILAEPSTRLYAAHVEPLECLEILMDPDRVRSVAERACGPDWPTQDLAPWYDPAIAGLAIEMRRVMIGDSRPPAAYLAALADALIVRVVSHLAMEHTRAPSGAIAPFTLKRVLRHIEASIAEPIAISDLAAIAGFSPAHFARAFAREMGDPPHRFVMKRRICRARDLLSSGEGTLAEVAARTGFSSQAHMSTAFLREVGTSPAKYRAVFAPAIESQSSLGRMTAEQQEEQRKTAP